MLTQHLPHECKYQKFYEGVFMVSFSPSVQKFFSVNFVVLSNAVLFV